MKLPEREWMKNLEALCKAHCESIVSELSEALSGTTDKPKRQRVKKNVLSLDGPDVPTTTVQPQPVAQVRLEQPLMVYLAGRISKADWRSTVVRSNGRLAGDEISDYEDWKRTTAVEMSDGNTYVGPFYLGCDHGCGHGPNSHGAGAGYNICVSFPSRWDVLQKAIAGIQACDLFYVWVGPDFSEAYGTLVEIGMARALGKKIVVARHPDAEVNDQWFAMLCAFQTFAAKDPVEGYKKVMSHIAELEKLLRASGGNTTADDVF